MEFNHSQKEAVIHQKGPMLVLAGPGSGKTMVITHRIRYLIQECSIEPNKILVITFTKAATLEMKQRFEKLMEGAKKPVWFGTFHAIFFTILRAAYHFDVKSILSEEQKRKFYEEIIEKLSLDIEDKTEFIEDVQKEISKVKSERIQIEHYYSVNCSEDVFRKIYLEYHQMLQRYRMLDFDDMLLYCYDLLVKRSDILKTWQSAFEYILIDEFQDINGLQYDVIKLLAKPEDNLFVVGDDDQSIYQFRGAKPELMLNFEKDYPDARKVLLDTNYRCSANILSSASLLIGNNTKRFQKHILPVHESGENVAIQEFQNLSEENNHVIECIKEYRESGILYKKMAVLFRTNTEARMLVGRCMDFNIPFRMKEKLPNIYEHWIAKDLMMYIKIAMGNRDRGNFLHIINRPKRYISREVFDTPTVDFDRLMDFYEDKRWMQERIEQLETDLQIISNMKPYAAINYIRKGVEYDNFIKEYAEFRRVKPEEWYDILDELKESSRPFGTFEEWFSYIKVYSDELKEQTEKKQNRQEDALQLMTMHSSKGLEFDVVFIIDANEKITPHRKAVLPDDVEEERRMFYVAMTRAKKYLNIFYVKERYNKEYKVSRFVEEIQK